MSAELWRHFIQHDVDAFRHLLANATYTSGASQRNGLGGNVAHKVGSPVTPGTLGVSLSKSRKGPVEANPPIRGQDVRSQGKMYLTRADVNSKDGFGRTLLHLAASSNHDDALDFVNALLTVPFLDLYTQDTESGWTALHRALYFGNVAIAQALMLRDIKDATDYTTSGLHGHAGGLIKIKDHEGNSPFEVFGLTIAPRNLAEDARSLAANLADDESGNSVDLDHMGAEDHSQRRSTRSRVNLFGDEVFAFGSNKNLTLGLGDEDDRQYPERINLHRPEHLLRHFHHEQLLENAAPSRDLSVSQSSFSSASGVPALIRNQSLKIQDVVMSKLHTAVITNDPEANLFICGFGPGGRLGTGDEVTRFNYVCVESGGLAGKRVAAVALGQDHSIAVSGTGEVFTWGSNKHGQLGYTLPQSSSANEVPVQLTPRQLFGPMKKEAIVGAAASSIHSVIFTASALYTFGKNEGQLGLMDADARSLEFQVMPRRVGVSVLQSAIEMVSAIDRATTILLENHDVVVLTHYGFTKIVFQLEGFTNYFLQGSFATRYDPAGNFIRKVTSGGNTICAMSSFGEVFTIDVPNKVDAASAGVSTTNPSKARNALPHPNRVWSIKKSHMAARDVAVGQYGSIILSTEAGSVWRKEKRAIIKDVGSKASGTARSKDYKFVRIPNITRAVGVRSNAFGAFMAIRRDCDVTQEQIIVDPPSLWNDLLPLLPFHDYGKLNEDSDTEHPEPRFWTPTTTGISPALIRRAILLSQNVESEFQQLLSRYEPLAESQYDLWITSNMTDVRIPVHSFMLQARSSVLRRALAEFQSSYYFSITDVLSIEYGQDGQIQIQFHGADFLTITNLVLYLYTESTVDVWHHTSRNPQSAARYRQIRTEVMKIATNLEMKSLERAARVMTEPVKCLLVDMETAFTEEDFFSSADLIIELADGIEISAHSGLLCCRCPFFDGLFHGRAGGAWLSSRRIDAEDSAEAVRVDLQHIDAEIFKVVLRHVYADTGEEIFNDVVTKNLDEFLDLVMEVLSVANELMLERLAQICQKLLGKFVITRNVCQLLNIVAPCSVQEFKHVGLEYIGLNLEDMLEHRYLEELDEDLLAELDEIVRQNQLAFMPFAKSGRAEAELLEQHAYLAGQIKQARERRIDSMQLRSRLHEDEERSATLNKFRVGSYDKSSSSPVTPRINRTPSRESPSPAASPALLPQDTGSDLLFEMDEERGGKKSMQRLRSDPISPSLRARDRDDFTENGSLNPEADGWFDAKGKPLASSVSTEASSLGSSFPRPRYSASPSASRTPVGTNTTSGFASSSTPWSAIRSTPAKTELKDIMAEASSTRPSNLTLAMNAKISEAARGTQKLSQKERKKLQQQQLSQKQDNQVPPAVSVTSAGPAPASSKPPWQLNTPVPKHDLTRILSSPSPSPIQPLVRPPIRAAMTMRQTVAGTPPVDKSEPANQFRSISTPTVTPSKPPPPQIQSIRHTPAPASPLLSAARHSSMADILSQQQTEKIAVKEAVAKRSLQEIQQQQEFEEWFDSESRRVQEEEAQASAAAAATSRDGSGKRGRGRGGRRSASGRGGAKSAADGAPTTRSTERQSNSNVPAAAPFRADISMASGRGRGGSRGSS